MKSTTNIAFSLFNLMASMLSSFILIPILFRAMGPEAAGYVAIGTTIVNTAQVFSIAITSMSTRYIVLNYHEDIKEANRYFNSILTSCLAMTFVVSLVFATIAMQIENLIDISEAYVGQMRMLIACMGGSFCLNVLSCPFLSGQYYRQDLRRMYTMQATSQIARIAAPILLFGILGPSIWLPYFAGLIVDSIALCIYYISNKSLLPGVGPSLKLAKREYVRIILSGGIWSSVNKAGAILLSSMSNYLSNIYVGRNEAGYYGSFLQLQQVFASFTTALVGALVPRLITSYAKDSNEEFFVRAFHYLKVLAVLLGIMSGVAITYELDFFKLWLGKPVDEYRTAAMLLLLFVPFAYPTEVLNQVLIIQVRVKVPALATVAIGLLSLLLSALFCLQMGMGLTGIALASFISQLLRSWVFLPVYISNGDGERLRQIMKGLVFGPVALCMSLAICTLLIRVLPPASGPLLFVLDIAVCGVITFICSLVFLSTEEKQLFSGLIAGVVRGDKNG